MADSIIGALRVVLGLDTAAFSAGAKEAEGMMSNLAGKLASLGAGLAAGLSIGAFVTEIKHAINSMDELGKASQKIGIPVEQLSGLKYAAELADVSMETLSTGVGKLSKAMVEGAAKPTSEAAKAFQQLGVSVKDADGNMRPTNDVLLALADRFSHLEDDAAKTAVAIALFGRGGKEMIPFLNQGKTGIEDLTAEAKQFGLVISTDVAKQAEQFNDTMKSLHARTEGLWIQIASVALPTLNDLASRFKESSKESDTFSSIVKGVESTLDEFRKICIIVSTAIDLVKASFNAATEAAKSYYDQLVASSAVKAIVDGFNAAKDAVAGYDFSATAAGAAVEYLKSKLTDQASSTQDAGDKATKGATTIGLLGEAARLAALEVATLKFNLDFAGYAVSDFGGAAAKITGAKDKLAPTFAAGTDAIDNFIKSQQKAIASTLAQAQTIGAVTGTFEGMKVSMDAAAIAAANHIKMSDAQRASIKLLADQAMAAAMTLKGAQITQEWLSPWDLYAQKIANTTALLKEQKITADIAAKETARSTAQMVNTYLDATSAVLGGLGQAFMAVGAHNKKLFEIGKAFAIAEATVNTFKAANMALAAPPGPPLSYAYVAAAIATGIANVVKISQQQYTGAAMGGSFSVPGAGGIDSRMVPIMMTPGEKVNVDQNKYGDSAGGSRTITLQGLKPKEYYRGDVLRDFVDNLNQAIGDGLKIKLA